MLSGSLSIVALPAFAADSSPDLVDSPLTLSLARTLDINTDSSVVTIDQYGIHNTTLVIQSANSTNLVNITQSGNDNYASISQLGIGNIVDLVQDGSSNNFEIMQQGDFNSANIHQLGEQSFIVHQIGNEMVVNITQYKK
ncbi:curlin subunit CsgB [Aliiglaciecola sp. LCG003]|uniref:curlin subunit CsgB n=1 Tax=Aliiglaciecola sp. LCG003 TaxID=3053655 RepID=UPI0025745AFC|nr:curlin subunit CsgB [Aliiglaciecola sp. LCG003]WJG10774.1 curlin subunit CsgB [Aliiglaciecola sp. LCG003]